MNKINLHEAKLVLLNGEQRYGMVEEKSLNERILNFIPFSRENTSHLNLTESIPMNEIHSIDLAIR